MISCRDPHIPVYQKMLFPASKYDAKKRSTHFSPKKREITSCSGMFIFKAERKSGCLSYRIAIIRKETFSAF